MDSELTLQNAIEQAPNARAAQAIREAAGMPNQPASMTPGEAADLDAFRIQLAEQNVESRRVAINGGVAGIVQKNRVEVAWLHANIFTKGASE